MRHFRYLCCLPLIVLVPMNSYSQSEATRNNVKEKLSFSTLPGKNGALKPGFSFLKNDYPELNAYSGVSDQIEIVASPGGRSVLRTMVMKKDASSDTVEIEIQVDMISTDNAQEGIVDDLLATSYLPLGLPIRERGDTNGINVGDFNFVLSGLLPDHIDQIGWLHFVRNNIRILVSQRSSTTGVNLVNLAQKIDQKILALPNVTPQQIGPAYAPAITAFAPASSTVSKFKTVQFNLTASDPQGVELKFKFRGSRLGGVTRDESAQPVRTTYFASGNATGTDTIEVIAIDDTLLWTSASATVEVTE